MPAITAQLPFTDAIASVPLEPALQVEALACEGHLVQVARDGLPQAGPVAALDLPVDAEAGLEEEAPGCQTGSLVFRTS